LGCWLVEATPQGPVYQTDELLIYCYLKHEKCVSTPYKKELGPENDVLLHFGVIFDWLQLCLAKNRPSALINFVSIIFKYREGGWKAKVIVA
jgi:hypothetical protein